MPSRGGKLNDYWPVYQPYVYLRFGLAKNTWASSTRISCWTSNHECPFFVTIFLSCFRYTNKCAEGGGTSLGRESSCEAEGGSAAVQGTVWHGSEMENIGEAATDRAWFRNGRGGGTVRRRRSLD